MATTTVRLQDALLILQSKYTLGDAYKYGDIAETLTEAFPKINKSQISGLITRLVNAGYFDKHKQLGARYDYIFRGTAKVKELNSKIRLNDNDDFKDTVQAQIISLANNLNELKTQITTPDDFVWLQKRINALVELSKD